MDGGDGMNTVVRRANTSDISDLLELNDQFNGPGCTRESIRQSLETYTQEIVFVAIVAERVVGFICGEKQGSFCASTFHGEITELFVAERFRRNGVARLLMQAMEDEFQSHDIHVVTLATSQTNVNAQAFYHHCGYTGKLRYEYRKDI